MVYGLYFPNVIENASLNVQMCVISWGLRVESSLTISFLDILNLVNYRSCLILSLPGLFIPFVGKPKTKVAISLQGP